MPAASERHSVVLVVDDDESVRRSLQNLFRAAGLEVQTFESAAEFLNGRSVDVPCCLVLDVKLPGVSGLELQDTLARSQVHIPIVFVTGYGDVPMTVQAMKAGAIDVLTKPYSGRAMLAAVTAAVERDRARLQEEEAVSRLRTLFDSLTPRERDVMRLVTAGLMNKQAAAELGLSEITVKIHRGHVMKKMRARSLADLIRMNDRLRSGGPSSKSP